MGVDFAASKLTAAVVSLPGYYISSSCCALPALDKWLSIAINGCALLNNCDGYQYLPWGL
ncbi:MAG: hypothetical protein KUG81_00875 [Gammaproteobacteria bacterium]|nr:hypothetical protein [Gammaproteobacteria bacterium]